MNLQKLVMAVALTALPFVAHAEGDPQAGKEKASACAACHGMDGIAEIEAYPHLAGQHEKYLITALKAYKQKQRRGGQAAIMQGMTANLSEEDIADLAAYYSSLDPE